MITLTGLVYHDDKPIFLCPLYHPCAEWEEQSNINKSGWITLSPSSSTLHPSNPFQPFSYTSTPSSPSPSFKTSTQLTPNSLPSPSPSPALTPESSPSTSITIPKKSPSTLPSLAIYSPVNGSGINFRFEADRWSLNQYNLTFYQFTFVFREVWRSKNFRRSVVRRELLPRKCRPSIRTLLNNGANIDLIVRFKTNDCHTTPIDWRSNFLFLALVSVKLKIEETLSILSTLGGAYSSLGEHYIHFAVKAGEISIKQIGLACVTADPTIIARCAIYMVYSLCQRNLRKRARRLMINFIHPYITKMIIKKTCDNIVRNMYKAAKFRIEHYYTSS